MSHQPPTAPSAASSGPCAGPGGVASQRDAGWAPAPPCTLHESGAQVLHRWVTGAGVAVAGLIFQSLDGNPRHGVLTVYRASPVEPHDAIEVLERQGHWVVMPDRGRARCLAAVVQAVHGVLSQIAGTPDRRYVFFNVLREGGWTTLVGRRQSVGVSMS